MLQIALVLAQRSTCKKLAVGCVLVDKNYRIIGSGYNGVPHKLPHCIEQPCDGALMPEGSDTCLAVHAEQNALLNCQDIYKIHACFVTHPPCLRCTKELLNTTCKSILYFYDKPVSTYAQQLWESASRSWQCYN